MGWVGHVARIGEARGTRRVLMGRPEGKRPLGRPRSKWEDSINLDFQEVRCDTDLLDLDQGRGGWLAFVNAVMNLPFSYNAGNFLTN
jgi:hypothetical protein